MKILHFSDTHLGLGIEQTSRDDDFYLNFEKVINEIIEKKIDIVIHSGDLFHTSKPSNKAISKVVKNFLKLEKKGISVVIIAGNHDTPRVSNTTHVFEIFNTFKNFYTFYEPKIQNIIINDINFITLPHIHDEEIFKSEFHKIPSLILDGKQNIFISHFGISASSYDEYTDEISGVNIKKEDLELLKNFDYVALGHYHNNFSIGKNIHYSGSIEHTSFNGKKHKVGYNIFDTDTLKKEITLINTRKIINFNDVDCSDFLNTDDIISHLEKTIKIEDIKDSILKISFTKISKKLIFEFEDKKIKNFFKEAFYFEYQKNMFLNTNENINIKASGTKDFIKTNFKDFFDNIQIEDKTIDKSKLETEILNLIKQLG